MEATALVYSGRPNPHWRVPEALAELVRHTLGASARPAVGGAEPPGLGYSGIRVQYEDESGGPHSADFFGGVVVAGGRRLADPERRVERALLASGAELYPQLRHFL